MELRQLKYFATLAETLNFSRAADKLFITQGTLSQQIRQLEDEVGSQLLERSSHHVTLTEAGEELLPLALSTLEASNLCMNRMRDLRGALTGTLNLGTTHSFTGLMADTVKAFLKQNPGVKLNIYYKPAAELLEMLRLKELDLALAFKPVMAYDDIESEVLFKTHLCAVMRKDHPLASRESINLEELENQGIALAGGGLQARRVFDSYVGVDTRKLNVRMEVNDPNLIMDIVQGSWLVAVLSELAAYYRTNLTAVPLENGKYKMYGCVHTLKDAYRKKSADVFLEMLRDSAQIERLCKNLEL